MFRCPFIDVHKCHSEFCSGIKGLITNSSTSMGSIKVQNNKEIGVIEILCQLKL